MICDHLLTPISYPFYFHIDGRNTAPQQAEVAQWIEKEKKKTYILRR